MIFLQEEALKAFVQPETLDGNNQYFCEKCNKKCDAHKVSQLRPFLKILKPSTSDNVYLLEWVSKPDLWKCSFCKIQCPMLDYSAMSHHQIQWLNRCQSYTHISISKPTCVSYSRAPRILKCPKTGHFVSKPNLLKFTFLWNPKAPVEIF